VFVDTGVIGTIDGTDTVLRIQKQFANQEALQIDNAIKVVTFNREGFVTGVPLGGTFTLHDSTSNPTAQYTRCLSFTIVGALSTQQAGANTAEGAPCT
jgi:type IV fimbrial biogenesis protein FimT